MNDGYCETCGGDTCRNVKVYILCAGCLEEKIRAAIKEAMPNAAPSVWDALSKRTSGVFRRFHGDPRDSVRTDG